MDGGRTDAGRAPDAGAARDTGVIAADAGRDAEPHDSAIRLDAGTTEPSDAGGPFDAGRPIICMADSDCPTGYCNHRIQFCGPRGICGIRPTSCDTYDAGGSLAGGPVCGCNGVTYDNDCQRQLAGAALDYYGRCDPPGECTVRTDHGCCYDIEDCSPRGYPPLPYTPICKQQTACGSPTAGRCIYAAFRGMCWDDADCTTPGQHCVGAHFCPCGDPTCVLDDAHPLTMGTCM